MGDELAESTAAWPDDYRVVKGWSEGTAILQDAMEKAGDADRVKAGFLASLESRREDWAPRMLRGAHVQKGSGKIDWNTIAGTAKALLDSRALEAIPFTEYVWERSELGDTAAIMAGI